METLDRMVRDHHHSSGWMVERAGIPTDNPDKRVDGKSHYVLPDTSRASLPTAQLGGAQLQPTITSGCATSHY